MGQVWEGTSPRWAGAPPHKGPRRLGFGEGVLPPDLGGQVSPFFPLGRTLDGFWGQPHPLGWEP